MKLDAEIFCISQLPRWVELQQKFAIPVTASVRRFLDHYQLSGLITEDEAIEILSYSSINPPYHD